MIRDDLFDQPDMPNKHFPIEDPRRLFACLFLLFAGIANFSSVENISGGSGHRVLKSHSNRRIIQTTVVKVFATGENWY